MMFQPLYATKHPWYCLKVFGKCVLLTAKLVISVPYWLILVHVAPFSRRWPWLRVCSIVSGWRAQTPLIDQCCCKRHHYGCAGMGFPYEANLEGALLCGRLSRWQATSISRIFFVWYRVFALKSSTPCCKLMEVLHRFALTLHIWFIHFLCWRMSNAVHNSRFTCACFAPVSPCVEAEHLSILAAEHLSILAAPLVDMRQY